MESFPFRPFDDERQTNSMESLGRPSWSLTGVLGPRLALSIGVPIASWCLARGCFVPLYESNDDIGMMMLARGVGIVGKPTPYLLYLHIWLGELLVALYQRWPGLEWYRLLMDVTQLASTATLVWLSTRSRVSLPRLGLLLLYLVVFDFTFYTRPQFTVTAMLPAIGASVLWFCVASSGGALTWPSLLWFLILFNLSALIRFQSALAVGIAVVPLLLFALIWSRFRRCTQSRVRLSTQLIPWFLALLTIGSGKLYHDHVYQSMPGWEEYAEFNRLRAEITDYGRVNWTDSTESHFTQAGWNHHDYELTHHWFFEDPEAYNIERFHRLLDYFPPQTSLRPVLQKLWSDIERDATFLAMLLTIATAWILIMRQHAVLISAGLSLVSVFALDVVLLVQLHRLPPHVYEPLLALPFWIPVAGSEDAPLGGLKRRIAFGLFWITSLVIAFRVIEKTYNDSHDREKAHLLLVQGIEDLEKPRGRVYVIVGPEFPFALLYLPADLYGLRNLAMIGTGTLSQSPINRSRLKDFGIENLLAALGERPDLYLIGAPDATAALAAHASSRLGVPVSAHQVYKRRFGKGYTRDNWLYVYRLVSWHRVSP
jgi:hypothetical protein